MQNKKGFSMLELLVAITIIGILSAMAAPAFTRMMGESKFEDQTQAIFDMISDARANALVNKKCKDDSEAKYWIVAISNSDIQLQCENKATVNAPEQTITYQAGITTLLSLLRPGSPGTATTTATIIFTTGTSQATIRDDSSTRQDAIKMTFEHPANNKMRTICMNGVAAYPTMTQRIATSSTDCVEDEALFQ